MARSMQKRAGNSLKRTVATKSLSLGPENRQILFRELCS